MLIEGVVGDAFGHWEPLCKCTRVKAGIERRLKGENKTRRIEQKHSRRVYQFRVLPFHDHRRFYDISFEDFNEGLT